MERKIKTKVTRRGYIIYKEYFDDKFINNIKKELTVKPFIHKDFAQNIKSFPVFFENLKKLYIPRFYGLEKIGKPDLIDIYEGDEIDIECKCVPKNNLQKNILSQILNILEMDINKCIEKKIKRKKKKLFGSGCILSIFCGSGKTCLALMILSRLKAKSIIVVHTSVLMDQWVERINEFMPDARIGIIKGSKLDIENKDIVIAMLQTLSSSNKIFPKNLFDQFKLTIIDECFTFDTKIITENGNKLIGTLYEMWINKKKLPKVLSYNQLNKKFEYKRITYAWRKERTKLLKIKVNGGIIKCTPEHKILTSNNYIKAKNLVKGDLLLSYNTSNNYGFGKVDSIELYNNKCYDKPYVYDIEVEDNHNFIVCGDNEGNMSQGVIVSNCHRCAAPTFSRALPLISSKYLLGLTATPKRNDNLEKIFYWHLGNIGNKLVSIKRNDVIVYKLLFNSKNYRVINRNYPINSLNIPKMVNLIIEEKERNDLLVNQACKLGSMGRQLLVLSSRKIHLKCLKNLIDTKNMYKYKYLYDIFYNKFRNKLNNKIMNIIKKFVVSKIEVGYYIGGMKKKDLKISSKKDIILATYQLVSEGTDIKTLNTLIMASPRKEVEQIIGRILRSETKFCPLVIDICDNFSIFANQSKYRNRYYKRNDYRVVDIDDLENINKFINYNSIPEIKNSYKTKTKNNKNIFKKYLFN